MFHFNESVSSMIYQVFKGSDIRFFYYYLSDAAFQFNPIQIPRIQLKNYFLFKALNLCGHSPTVYIVLHVSEKICKLRVHENLKTYRPITSLPCRVSQLRAMAFIILWETLSKMHQLLHLP